MTTQLLETPQALTINQRNLYLYYLNHKKKYKNAPCFVPRSPAQKTVDWYLNALKKLEQYGLIRVDRSSNHYTGWIMNAPKPR